MKKRLFILGMTSLISSSLFSQTTLFYEDFATALTQHVGWTVLDEDDDTYTWGFYDFGLNPSATLNPLLNTSLNVQGRLAISSSWSGTALTPDNYLISPAISLADIPAVTGNISLSFKLGSTQSSSLYTSENISVYIVTDTSSASAINITTPVHSAVLAGVGINSFTYDISSHGGETIYIAFRHHNCADQGDLLLDDIAVVKALGVGLSENQIISKVYPNPVTNVLNFQLEENISMVTILSIEGKTVSTQIVNNMSAKVDVLNLPTGFYTYRIVTEKGKVLQSTFSKN